MEFRLENPTALWGLILVLCYLGVCFWKRKHLRDSFLWRRTLLNSLALSFCLLGLSRPQGGESVSTQVAERANLFLAIDISQSMLAQDVSPSRMRFAIEFSQRLLDQLQQIKIALYPFALDGYIQMPLSTDFQAAKDLLASMSPSMATGQGTDLGAVLSNLLNQIQRSERVAKERGSEWVRPQVLLISDGETHIPFPDSVAQTFRNMGIPIFTVCTGNKKDIPIPLENKFGGSSFLKDPEGKTVLTRANPELLQKIAEVTGGTFFKDSFQEVPKLVNRLNQSLQIGKLSTAFHLSREFYPFCFTLAFLFLLVEFSFSRWDFAIRSLILPLLLLIPVQSYASEPLENESSAIEYFNQGVKAYNDQNLREAADQLEKSIFTSLEPSTRKKALFNLGNVYFKMGEMEQAIQAYQQSLDTKTSSSDFDKETNQKISDNLALSVRKMAMEQKKKSNEPKQGEGEGEGKNEGKGSDPKGPKKFQDEGLSDEAKRKVFDHISEEERQTLKRLAEDKNKKSSDRNMKPW